MQERLRLYRSLWRYNEYQSDSPVLPMQAHCIEYVLIIVPGEMQNSILFVFLDLTDPSAFSLESPDCRI